MPVVGLGGDFVSWSWLRVAALSLVGCCLSAADCGDSELVFPPQDCFAITDRDGDEWGVPISDSPETTVQRGEECPLGTAREEDFDCDDTDRDVHPGSVELLDNLVDENCNGSLEK